MLHLARPNALFIGQGVRYGASSKELQGVPLHQRIEFPVAEELQLGFCIGLSLKGYLPICIYPRMDFMLRAADQLVNHLDKLITMSCGQFQPKVIIRTRVGSRTPLDAGPQHTQDHSTAFRHMLTSIPVVPILRDDQIIPVYDEALERTGSTLVVEHIA